MFEDYFQSVKATLYDRVSSPLWGAFSISWIAWNHRMLIVLFSPLSPDEKFSYIGNYLYTDWGIYALYWGLWPLLTAAVFIGLVPALGEYAYRVSRFWKVRLKTAKLEYDGKTPMSQDEVNDILISAAEEKRILEDRIVLAVKESKVAEDRLKTVSDKFAELQSQNSILESKLAATTNEIEDLKISHDIEDRLPMSDEQLHDFVVSGLFELVHNAKTGRSKIITFNKDGLIGEGRNDNEHRWEIDSGDLLIFTHTDELQNQFEFQRGTSLLTAVDDVEVKAPPNQFIRPIDQP